MDGIISGKIEKLAGTLEFRASIHVDMVEGHVSLQAESTTDMVDNYFKLVMKDDSVLLGKVVSFQDTRFTSGSFTGVNAIVMSYTSIPSAPLYRFVVSDPNYSYSISNAFKYLEIGTLS